MRYGDCAKIALGSQDRRASGSLRRANDENKKRSTFYGWISTKCYISKIIGSKTLKSDYENTEKMIMKTDDVKRARWSCRYVGK